MKGRARRSILELPLKIEITIHDYFISQLDCELVCSKQKEIEFFGEIDWIHH